MWMTDHVKPLASRTDEGELDIALTRDGDNLIIDFGKPVHWIALPKGQAIDFAKLILRRCVDRYLILDVTETSQ